MKKRMKLCCFYLVLTLFTLASAAVAQDGTVRLSSGDNSAESKESGIVLKAGDGASMKIGDKGIELKAKGEAKEPATAHPSTNRAPGSGPLELTKDTKITGRKIVSAGDGVILKANGDYILVDCDITAGKNGIVVTGNATVTLKNCRVSGGTSAISISGNGTLKASDNVINGKIKKDGNAEFIDAGGNKINKS